MSESRKSLYDEFSHPHAGDPRVDHKARSVVSPKASGEQINPDEKELDAKAIYEDLNGKRVILTEEVPFNHKWFKGEFHTSSWGSDQSPYAGETKDRVRVSMMGTKLSPTVHNGIASASGVVTAVISEEDRGLIGKTGWWKLDDLSKTSVRKRRSRKAA